jgi:NADP-dependent 3-hydroxy acid dehydrogenase YdfG
MEKSALITGATSGIGRALAELLADRGFRLVLFGRSEEKASALERDLRGRGASVHVRAFDLCDMDALDAAVRWVFEHLSGLDVLVNNAGMTLADPGIDDADAAQRILATNMGSVFAIVGRVLPLLKARPGAIVVNVTSTAAVAPLATQALYSASKAGVVVFGDAIREELRPHGVRVTNVLPGRTRTDILRHLNRDYLERFAVESESRIEPSDVARAIRFAIEQPADVSVDQITITPAR